jgi:hypothetical protein
MKRAVDASNKGLDKLTSSYILISLESAYGLPKFLFDPKNEVLTSLELVEEALTNKVLAELSSRNFPTEEGHRFADGMEIYGRNIVKQFEQKTEKYITFTKRETVLARSSKTVIKAV